MAGAITPVPGGMGPVTIVMLVANTARSAELAAQRCAPPRLSTAGMWATGAAGVCAVTCAAMVALYAPV